MVMKGAMVGRRRLATVKQIAFSCAFPQEGSRGVGKFRKRRIIAIKPPCEYSKPVPFVP